MHSSHYHCSSFLSVHRTHWPPHVMVDRHCSSTQQPGARDGRSSHCSRLGCERCSAYRCYSKGVSVSGASFLMLLDCHVQDYIPSWKLLLYILGTLVFRTGGRSASAICCSSTTNSEVLPKLHKAIITQIGLIESP